LVKNDHNIQGDPYKIITIVIIISPI